MESKAIIQKIIGIFDDNDTEALINMVTDDFEWVMVGDMTIKGKEELKKMFSDAGDITMVGCTKDYLVVDGNVGMCNGIVQMKENGTIVERYYCDIYELSGGKLKKMTTYTLPKK